MPAEQFANLAETTLSAAYTAGQGFIEVTSTATFPTLPTFRVRIGNTGKTIFRVDWVYGTRFYGAAEYNDANANSGDSVSHVLTKALLERMLQSPDSGIFAPTGSQGLTAYGPLFKMGGFDQSAWSWVNNGTGAYLQQGGGVLFANIPSRAGTNLTLRVTSLPARPWSVTAGFAINFSAAGSISNLLSIGLALRESGTSKIQIFVASNFKFSSANAPAAIWLGTYASATSATSVSGEKVVGTDITNLTIIGNLIFLRLSDDGTNVTWEWSWDKINWFLHTKQARTTGFTTAPDQYGLVFNAQSGGPLQAHVISLEQVAGVAGIQPGTGALTVTGKQTTRTP